MAETKTNGGKAKKNGGLVAKLCEVMGEIDRIPKRGHNDFFNYDYVLEADVSDALRKALSKRGVFVIPSVAEVADRDVTTQKGRVETVTRVTMDFTFVDADTGEERTFRMIGQGQDAGDKGTAKAVTAATKYALLKSFMVSSGDDPEADTSVDQRSAERTAPKSGGSQSAPGKATEAQLKYIWKLAQECSWDAERVKAELAERYGVESSKQLAKGQASEFIDVLQQHKDELEAVNGDAEEVPEEAPF